MSLESVIQPILILVLSTLVGWGTNLLAIRMLFYPRRPIIIGRWRIQGLIPRRHHDIASRTAEIVERELLDTHAIAQECKQIDLSPYIDDYAHKLVHGELKTKLRSIPMLGTLLGQDLWKRLEGWIANEMKQESGVLLSRVANDIEHHIHIRDIVERRMIAFDLERLEELIFSLAAREFRHIEYLGAIVGAFVGLVQVMVLFLLGTW